MSKSTFEEEINKSGSLCYTIKGVSMLPLLHQHRDIVVIEKPVGRLKKYDVALYQSGGRYVLHRVLKVRERDYVICGDNCFRREYGICDGDIIGVMESFVRNARTHRVDEFGYRVYSHLIADLYYMKAAVLWCKYMVLRVLRKIYRLIKGRE